MIIHHLIKLVEKLFKNQSVSAPKATSFLFLSLSIFTFQNLLGPTFSTLLTGMWQAWVAIPSFLGIGFGLWLSITYFKKYFNLTTVERLATHALFFSFVSIFLLLNFLSHRIDQNMIDTAATLKDIHIIEKLIGPALLGYIPLLLSIVSVPFILFGIILGAQFSKSDSALNAYRLELVGILIGSVLCIWLLESHSWSTVVVVIVGLSVLATIFLELYFSTNKKVLFQKCAASLIIFGLFLSVPTFWQLQRNLNLVVRDFHQMRQVKATATRWKSFAKVQLLDSFYKTNHRRLISIGDGTGIAKFFSYDEQFLGSFNLVTVNLAVFANPKKVAVLFAGAGAELIGIHKKLGDQVQTWGVEINSAIPEIVAVEEGSKFTQFFKQYNSQFVITDNRRFLETSKDKFDSIVFSWSGATVANFSGAILHTTQYSFTTEALTAAIERLEKNGTLIILGGNKLNIIKSLKTLESQGVLQNIKDKILMFAERKGVNWKSSWDDFIFVYKNQDWTQSEAEAISANVANLVMPILKFNEEPYQTQLPYLNMLSSNDIDLFSESLWQSEQILPTQATDDYPFAYRNYPSIFSNSKFSWRTQIVNSFLSPNYTALDGIFWTATFFMLLILISLIKKDISISYELVQFLAWAVFSAGCTLYYLYKTILYFGDPTIAYLIVQVGAQLGALVGLQFAIKDRFIKFKNYALISGILIVLMFVYLLQDQGISNLLFQLKLILSQGLFAVVIGITNFLFAFYFLSGLIQTVKPGTKKFGLFWTFETLFAGLASLFGAFMIEEKGLMFFVTGSFILAVFLILSAALAKRI